MPTLMAVKLECELIAAGTKLLDFSSLATTQPIEILIMLEEVEGLLREVGQAPCRSMKDALHPSMKALISDKLLKHSDIDVKVSVASCLSELIRITCPNAPYADVQMKDIFELTVMALRMLYIKGTRNYYKALRILRNMRNVRACVLMEDLKFHELIADIFKLFLSIIRYNDSCVVFKNMESIMTRTLKESEEISDELLSILLGSINKYEEFALSRTWMLGERVMMNCTVRLQEFLPKIVRSKNLNVDDYSTVVATICVNSPEKDVDYAEEK